MTDLNQKVEEARMVFVSHIARLTLTNEGGGIDGPAVQAYRALEAAIAARATAPLADLLREMEWVTFYDDDNGGIYDQCPVCVNHKTEGHAPDCKLGTLLGRLP